MENLEFKIVSLVFILVDFLLALLCFACGIWFHASADINAYMRIFVLNQNDQTLLAAAGIMLSIGVTLPFVCVLGALTVLKENWHRLFRLFLAILPLFLLLGLIAGFLPVGLKYDIHRYVKDGMTKQLQNNYTPNSKISLAWNRVQVKKRCCGIDGAWDYDKTNWYAKSNPDLDNPTVYVPDSCCALNFNQDRELYWVDPEKLQPKDKVRCNEDAWGYIDNSANLNRMGCFAALFSVNSDLWHDQSIWTIINVITGVCLATGFFQIVVFIVGLLYLRLSSYDVKKPPVFSQY